MAGAIDVAAERRRMEKDLAAARSEAEQAARKLDNADFTAKAPAAVVAKTRQRLEAAQADIARLEQRLAGDLSLRAFLTRRLTGGHRGADARGRAGDHLPAARTFR